MDIMKVNDVKKVYSLKNSDNKSEALRGISFTVPKGEFLGIMGPSGAGKSTLLRRAFTNILCNEVIHNPADAVIKVCIKQSDKLYVTIEDNGRGMTQEDVTKLFERYYRGTNSSENIKGSGLGMSIAKQIIEGHRGKIRVESELGEGTRINVEFLYDNKLNPEENV